MCLYNVIRVGTTEKKMNHAYFLFVYTAFEESKQFLSCIYRITVIVLRQIA